MFSFFFEAFTIVEVITDNKEICALNSLNVALTTAREVQGIAFGATRLPEAFSLPLGRHEAGPGACTLANLFLLLLGTSSRFVGLVGLLSRQCYG